MSYELEAFLGSDLTLGEATRDLKKAQVVQLDHGVSLLPMTEPLFDELQAAEGDPDAPGRMPGEFLTPAVARWARLVSMHGLIAYCEAAYANSMGGQSAVIWHNGSELDRLDASDSINQVLRQLGIRATSHTPNEHGLIKAQDEWDTVGLGRFRKTSDWLQLVQSL